MNTVKQNTVLIGKYEKFQDNTLYYTKGDKCWNGPQRSISVKLECGSDNIIKSVSEPSTCVYEMIFITPIVCKDIKQV